VDLTTNTIRKITIVYYTNGTPALLVYAKKGQYVKDPTNPYDYHLTDIIAVRIDPNQQTYYYLQQNKGNLEQLTQALTQSPEQMEFLHRDPATLSIAQAHQQIEVMKTSGSHESDIRAAEISLWSRVALPFSALVFAVIGAPLGLRPQRSSRMTGWFLAILIIFGYYVLMTTMNFAAQGRVLPPALAAFIPNAVGLAVGGALIWRASR
jgi:lipopolysaccharide export system permease protein